MVGGWVGIAARRRSAGRRAIGGRLSRTPRPTGATGSRKGVFKEESPPPTPPPTPKEPFNVFGNRDEENRDEEEKADQEGGVVIVETPGRQVVVIVIAEISVPASQPHLSPARTSALLPKALGGPSCFILSRV